jgi:hypothetical protein
VIVEGANSGIQLWQEIKSLPGVNCILPKPTSDKATRMMLASALLESGRVYLLESAPWLATFRKEVLAFPNGRYDDQVDSVSQYLNWAKNRFPKRKAVIFGTSHLNYWPSQPPGTIGDYSPRPPPTQSMWWDR